MSKKWQKQHMLEPVSPEGIIPLLSLKSGERGILVELVGGSRLVNRLAAFGFTPGVEVTLLQNFGHGPLIVFVRDTRLALGRHEAAKMFVRAS